MVGLSDDDDGARLSDGSTVVDSPASLGAVVGL